MFFLDWRAPFWRHCCLLEKSAAEVWSLPGLNEPQQTPNRGAEIMATAVISSQSVIEVIWAWVLKGLEWSFQPYHTLVKSLFFKKSKIQMCPNQAVKLTGLKNQNISSLIGRKPNWGKEANSFWLQNKSSVASETLTHHLAEQMPVLTTFQRCV